MVPQGCMLSVTYTLKQKMTTVMNFILKVLQFGVGKPVFIETKQAQT